MHRANSLFISHGSPDTAIVNTSAHEFLKSFARTGTRPDAIVVVSAHFEAAGVAISGDWRPQTIHDFGGFPAELRQIEYAAPGCPELADEIAHMLQNAGLAAGVICDRGFDHGTWVPLFLMYPEADIPIVQVSVDPAAGPGHHYSLGRALEPLCHRNIQIVGSGSMTHNLREAMGAFGSGKRDAVMPQWVSSFVNWIEDRLLHQDMDRLLAYRKHAPHAVRNHPTDEHLMPLFCALGAAGENWTAERLHRSNDFGVLSMDAYAFMPGSQ